MTKKGITFLIRSLVFFALSGSVSAAPQIPQVSTNKITLEKRNQTEPRKSKWSQDLSLLKKAAQSRPSLEASSRANVKSSFKPSVEASRIKLRQLEFELKQSLDQRRLDQFDQIRASIMELFPKYRVAHTLQLEEAILRFENKQYARVLEISRGILREPKAREFYPRALLIRAQAFRELGLATAALGTYEILTKKFPRSPQAQLGDLEANAMRLSVKR